MANTKFNATVTSINGCEVSAETRDFKITVDEPKSSGGTNKGMNPVELLLNSLGACQVIVAKSFAKAKGIKLNKLKVEEEGILDPDGFSGKNPNVPKGFSEIKSTFFIDADNTDEEIQNFVDFVNSICPVHNTLEHTPKMHTAIKTYVK